MSPAKIEAMLKVAHRRNHEITCARCYDKESFEPARDVDLDAHLKGL